MFPCLRQGTTGIILVPTMVCRCSAITLIGMEERGMLRPVRHAMSVEQGHLCYGPPPCAREPSPAGPAPRNARFLPQNPP